MIHFIILSLLILFLLLWSKLFIDSFNNSKNHYLKLIICIICACVFKCDWGTHFLGLEYEDAYSFSAYTRQLSHNIISDTLRIQCVDIGSLFEPQSLGTYGGHYITYSVFLYLFTSIFGFSITAVSIVNTLISLFSLLTIAFYNYKNKHGWLIAVSFFCFAPAINLFSTCFFSETFSAFLCICFVLGFFANKGNDTALSKLFVLLSFFLCILTKRDNLILIIIPLIYSIYEFYNRNYKLTIKYITPYILLIGVSILFFHNFFIAELEESSDISQSTFSFKIFYAQLPIYIKSLCSLSYFSICTYCFIISLCFCLIKHKMTKESTCLTTLFFLSIFMYSSHYRGYYFIEHLEEFNEFATFRYINNFFYLIPIFIALTFNEKQKYFRYVLIGLVALGIYSAYYTYSLRIKNSQEEYVLRFEDINGVNEILCNDDVIITDVPLLFLNVISPDINICNIQRIKEVDLNANKKFYIFTDDLEVLDKRYRLDISKIDKQYIKTLPSGKKLYLIK